MTDAIMVKGLWWRYPTYSEKIQPWTLRDINLQVAQGECFGITGPGGAGKTTLCRTLLGILPTNARLTAEQLPQHFRGTIAVLSKPVTAQTTGSNQIGMVMQDPENQFLRMSLLHELAFGLQIQNVPRAEIIERIHEALHQVGLDQLWQGAAYIHPADLSGGQKQRIAIAAFLALRPQVLILDEPTSDLDPVGKREVIETIARLRGNTRMTVILVEQDPEILSAFCDRIALLYEGHIELVAAPAEFYSQRELLEKYGVSVGELARISWHTGLTYQSRPPLTLEEAESAFTPALLKHLSSKPHEQHISSTHDVVAQGKDVWYTYEDGTTALHGVDLTLLRGEMLALLGPNGSGKTTFARILSGIYRPSRGYVQVSGHNILDRRTRKRLAGSVGYVFQNPDHQLFTRSVRAEIDYGLKNLGIDPKRRSEIVDTTLSAVDLARVADEDPLFLSKGQRQRLAVASVLAMGPEILIVDEPTTGQDYRSITSIMHLLRSLQQQGTTIIVITHDLTLVAEYCQSVVAFRDGHLAFTGTPTELFESEEVLQHTGLQPPVAAALANRVRSHYPSLPSLLTVEQWSEFLNSMHCER